MTPLSKLDFFVILFSVLIDTPFLMKITEWRIKTSILASLFVNFISLLLGIIIFIFIQLYHIGILKVVGAITFPFYYFDLKMLTAIIFTLVTLVPFLIMKPFFKLIGLKLFSHMIRAKQTFFGFKGFFLLLLANAVFVAVMVIFEKLL